MPGPFSLDDDDPLKPFKVRSPFAGLRPFGGSGRPPAEFTPLPADRAAEATDTLVNKGLSGLSWLGSTLDKAFGARAIRGALAGDTREALSVVPFSDTLGLTDPSKSHSMDELLQKAGVVKPNDPTAWELRDFLVPAAEIAADPGSYLTFGGSALSKAGKLAKAAGVLPKAHRAIIEGFHALEPELRAAGRTAEEIAHLGRQGQRIAPTALVDTAKAAGVPLRAGTPLGGYVGLGLPFGESALTLGHGPLAQAAAGAADRAKDFLKFRAPGVKTLRQLFDPAAGRSAEEVAQRAFEDVGRPASEGIEAAARRFEFRARHSLEPILRGAPAGGELEALRLARQHLEGVADAASHPAWAQTFRQRVGAGLAPSVGNPAEVEQFIRTHWDTLKNLGQESRTIQADYARQAERAGLSARRLNDEDIAYGARQSLAARTGGAGPGRGAGAGGASLFGTSSASNLGRKEALHDVPGGTALLDELIADPRFSGSSAARLAPRDVRDAIHQRLTAEAIRSTPSPAWTPQLLADLDTRLRPKSADLERFLRGVNPLHAAEGVPYFNPDVVADTLTRGQRQAKVIGAANALISGAAGRARPIAELAGQGGIPLPEFLKQAGLRTSRPFAGIDPADIAHLTSLGLDPDAARQLLRTAGGKGPAAVAARAQATSIPSALQARLQQRGYEGAAARLYEQMAQHGLPLPDLSGGTDILQQLGQYAIHPEHAGALTRFMQGWNRPEELRGLMGKLDSLNNLFKNFAYPLWPASHVRNAVSAVYNNWLHGTPVEAYGDALRLMRGGVPQDVAGYARLHPQWATLTPEARASFLNELAYAHGKVYQGVGASQDVIGRTPLDQIGGTFRSGSRITPIAPGSDRFRPGSNLVADTANLVGNEGLLGAFRPGSRNPLGQAGLGGRTQDTWAPLVAGRQVGTNIEDFVRLANYLGNLRKGYHPEAAGALTRAIHFDYHDLTPFERNIAQKVVPFYTFARKNLPYQLGLLGSRPGAISAPLHALTEVDQNRAGYVPDYLASGVAIPWGQSNGPNGERLTRYLSGLGLPFEEAFQRFKFKNYELPGGLHADLPNAPATMLGMLGMTTPYLKGPLEFATGTQIHSGRKLADLHSQGLGGGLGLLPEEYAQPLAQAVANSPLTRFASAGTTAIDPRKSLDVKLQNLLTGFKLTDVDRDKLRQVEARKELEAQLRQDPNVAEFTNLYVKPTAGPLDPATQELMRLYAGFKLDAQHIAERNRQRAAVRP